MEAIGRLDAKMIKLENEAARTVDEASQAILQQICEIADKLGEERRMSAMSKALQKAKFDKELDKVVDKYDSELDQCRKKFEREKDVFTRSLNKAGEDIAKERRWWMSMREQA